MGLVLHWNCLRPGTVKAMYGLASLANCICQNPEVRSKAEKTFEPVCPMSLMHSSTPFMLYLSGRLIWLTFR